jgi:hypothetical protein
MFLKIYLFLHYTYTIICDYAVPKIYLFLHRIYTIIYNLILSKCSPLYIIYYLNGSVKKNITLSSYFTFFNNTNLSNGVYEIKIYNYNNVYHLAYYGKRDNLKRLICTDNIPELLSKRKNIILMNHGQPVNFDLNLLDNYKKSIENQHLFFEPSEKNNELHICIPIRKLNIILKLFECNATDIQIISLLPFKKEIIPIDNKCSIDILYK